jgi:hypothetical protein
MARFFQTRKGIGFHKKEAESEIAGKRKFSG